MKPARMTNQDRTTPESALTELILEVFRLNGRLLSAGDRLVESLDLSSARWQVLGAIQLSPELQTVSGLARNMGLSRQAVQRLVNTLVEEGLAAFADNPAHRRAPLVAFTHKGRAVYAAAERRQAPWAADLAKAVSRADIERASRVLGAIRARLEGVTDED
jgi:DNA-binding MarR family transcriptional regulator